MAASRLTPSMLNALDGLLANQGLRRDPVTASLVAQYRDTPVAVAALTAVSSQGRLYGAAKTEWDRLVAAIRPLLDMWPAPSMSVKGFGSTAASFDVGPNISNIVTLLLNTPTLSTTADMWAAITLFNGDLKKFCQYFVMTRSHLEQLNAVLGPAENSRSPSALATFKGTTAQTTGGLTELSTDLPALAADLAEIGYAMDFEEVKHFGNPLALLRAIVKRAGGLPLGVSQALDAQGLTPELMSLASTPGNPYSGNAAFNVLQAFLTVTGIELKQVRAILKNTTPGVETLADLVDPAKLFHSSKASLVTRTAAGQVPIYVGPIVNPVLSISTKTLGIVLGVPPATACIAISTGLQQLTGVERTTAVDLSKALLATQDNTGLQQVTSQTQPVTAVGNIRTAMGQDGTGPKKMYLLRDAFGSISGLSFRELFEDLLLLVNQVDPAPLVGPLSALVWPVATQRPPNDPDFPNQWVLETSPPVGDPSDPGYEAGTYIVGPTPASVYSNADYIALILPNLVIAANAAEATYAGYTEIIDLATEVVLLIIEQLRREQSIRNAAETELGFYFAQTPAQNKALTGFASSLHDFGVDIAEGGASEVVDRLANLATLGGQAIIAGMREGRNIKALRGANITVDSFLPLVDLP